jgi:uncharacterized protein YkwD
MALYRYRPHPRRVVVMQSIAHRLTQISTPAALAALVALASGVQPPPVSADSRAEQRCQVDNADAPMEAIELQVLEAINAYRRERGAQPVTTSAGLRRAAMWKSQDRGRGGPEAHDDPFRRWDQRLSDCGYDLPTERGENLAVVSGDLSPEREAEMIIQAWKDSPAHDSILTDPDFRVAGIARVRVSDAQRSYWTADFGAMPE